MSVVRPFRCPLTISRPPGLVRTACPTGLVVAPSGPAGRLAMPRVVGVDHLVLSVGDLARSKLFYRKLLGFLGFKLKYDYAEMAGWSNGKTLLWIAAADEQGRKHKYRKGEIGFPHYAVELAS